MVLCHVAGRGLRHGKEAPAGATRGLAPCAGGGGRGEAHQEEGAASAARHGAGRPSPAPASPPHWLGPGLPSLLRCCGVAPVLVPGGRGRHAHLQLQSADRHAATPRAQSNKSLLVGMEGPRAGAAVGAAAASADANEVTAGVAGPAWAARRSRTRHKLVRSRGTMAATRIVEEEAMVYEVSNTTISVPAQRLAVPRALCFGAPGVAQSSVGTAFRGLSEFAGRAAVAGGDAFLIYVLQRFQASDAAAEGVRDPMESSRPEVRPPAPTPPTLSSAPAGLTAVAGENGPPQCPVSRGCGRRGPFA